VPPIDDARISVPPATMAALLLTVAGVVIMGCFPGLLQNWIANF
jgi:uncharacterized membrane protein YdjX (TVP38/TMEM64 family)